MSHLPIQQQPATNRTVRRIALALLITAAVGQLFNNVALAKIGAFPVTIPMLLLAAVAALASVTPRRRPADDTLLVLSLILLGWQVFVGLALGLVSDREWLQPFLLFCFYTVCFIFASQLSVDRSDIHWAITTLAFIVMVFGGLAVVQFILLNLFQIVPALPEQISAVPWNPLSDIYRTDGVLRPAGFSYEPSTFSIALSVALVLFMLLSGLVNYRNRKLVLISGLFLLLGSLLTLSLSGWAVALPALLVSALHARFRRITIPVIIVVAAVVIGAVYAGFAPVVTDRLNDVASGRDDSANVRVLAALHLLVHPAPDVAQFFIGYGWGQNSFFMALMDEVYLGQFGFVETNIHNIFTIVRVTQGWVGIGLHILLLLVIARPGVRLNRSLFLPIFVTIFVLHFASGFYLDPVFWSLLALIAVLRSNDAALEATDQRRQMMAEQHVIARRPIWQGAHLWRRW